MSTIPTHETVLQTINICRDLMAATAGSVQLSLAILESAPFGRYKYRPDHVPEPNTDETDVQKYLPFDATFHLDSALSAVGTAIAFLQMAKQDIAILKGRRPFGQ